VRPEGLCHWKIPVTPSGIEPATCRFVAYCLNRLSQLTSLFSRVLLGNIRADKISWLAKEKSTVYKSVSKPHSSYELKKRVTNVQSQQIPSLVYQTLLGKWEQLCW
jgi:hypothetical protein